MIKTTIDTAEWNAAKSGRFRDQTRFTEHHLHIRAVSGHARQLSRISGARMGMDTLVRAMRMRDLINTEYAPCTSAFE